MFSQMPKTAKRWAEEMKESTGKKHPIKGLPKRVKGSKSTPTKTRKATTKQKKKKK